MKQFKSTIAMGGLLLLLLFVNRANAQQFTLKSDKSSVLVLGTSSLHDWEVTAENIAGSLKLKDAQTGDIDQLKIEVVSESLKSGKSTMDKNTYKALKTKDHKNIVFQLTGVQGVSPNGNGKFKAKITGDLTIAGTKKSIPLELDMEVTDSAITLSGDKKIKMTEFNIDPPKALLGTVTTGDDITIRFNTVLTK